MSDTFSEVALNLDLPIEEDLELAWDIEPESAVTALNCFEDCMVGFPLARNLV